DDFVSIGGEDAEHDEDVGVCRRGRNEQLNRRRSGDFRLLPQRRRYKCNAVARRIVFEVSFGGGSPAQAPSAWIKIELRPLRARNGPLIFRALDKSINAANLEPHARLVPPAIIHALQKIIEETLLQ